MYRSNINGLEFTWDERKAARNLKKHGVSFEDAATAFDDPKAYDYFDAAHSDSEDRFILIGFSRSARLLIVCHCRQAANRKIRLISARRANGQETQAYF